ncbi:MAG TPA: TRAM domain-containing protein [Vicinamibacterales bacterium]|nr:TRAM domain-containing protein [Vicinamibacterales bacterium]
MIAPGSTLPLLVEKPAVGGRMIARVDGQIVLLAGAIPGERVQARIERVGKGVVYADTVSVDEPSPDRRPPFTDLACGGSLYAHIAYPRQLTIKAQVIADAFARIGHLHLPSGLAVAASPEEGYRMRARLHVRDRRVGFFREGSHEVCDARETRQLLPASCDVVDRLSAALRSVGADAVREIELSENVEASERAVHFETAGRVDPRILETLASIDGITNGPHVTDTLQIGDSRVTLRRHVQAFFQGNRYLLADLVAHVVDRVPIGGGLVDLYAGVGLFAVAAAVVKGALVAAVEGDPCAATDLQANAAAAGGQMITLKGAVEGFLSSGLLAKRMPGPPAETVVVDPPRTGMSRTALDALVAFGASRIVYVSCDVATLARDARRIVDAGYSIARADAFDLFPNTPHVETVVVFER